MRFRITIFAAIGCISGPRIGLAKDGCIHVVSRMNAADPADHQRVLEIIASGKTPKGFRDGAETRALRPRYPPSAKKNGLEGQVRLRARVGVDGKVSFVEYSIGPPEFVKTVLAKVRDLRYRPFQLDGVNKEMTVDMTVAFSLRDVCHPVVPGG